MITEKDLQEAIAACQGVRHPDAKTCMMLASFFVIRNELFPRKEESGILEQYSYDAPPEQIGNTIRYQSDTDFGSAIFGKSVDEILSVMDETMDAIQVLNPQLYKSVMRKIE